MMSKRIKQVRRSIEQRKKVRGIQTNGMAQQQMFSPFVQEEEKHGYSPIYDDSGSPSTMKNKVVSNFLLKAILSVLLFLSIAIIWQINLPQLEEPKAWLTNALTEEFPFAKVNAWYQETFGSPLALLPESESEVKSNDKQAMPVNGSVSESFQMNGTGIKITPEGKTAVTALKQGVVIFAGNDQKTKQTIIVQHPDDSQTTYGFLSNIDVHLYQHVSANQAIGQFDPSEENKSVYFSIEMDNQYIDPVQVIQVDDVE
jgi:stage IV sporulation protein FA